MIIFFTTVVCLQCRLGSFLDHSITMLMPINLPTQYLERIPRSQVVDYAHSSPLFVPRSADLTTIIAPCVLILLYFLPKYRGMVQHSPCTTSLDNPSKKD